MKISYTGILKSAWSLTIKNRFLWWFGIFASFISLEAVYEIFLKQLNEAITIKSFHLQIINLYQYQMDFLVNNIYMLGSVTKSLSLYIIVVLMLTVIMLFIWLAFVSLIFIIKTNASLYKNKTTNGKLDFNHSFEKFWPVLTTTVLAKLAVYAGYIVLSLPLLYSLLAQNLKSIYATDIIFLMLYTILAIIISFLNAYAINFIVLQNSGVISAFKQAWQLFKKNIGISLEMATVLFFIKIASVVLIFSLSYVVIYPMAILLTNNIITANLIGSVMSITIILLFFTIFSVLINAIFTCLYLSCWTILFIKLSEKTYWGQVSHTLRAIMPFFKKQEKTAGKKASSAIKAIKKH